MPKRRTFLGTALAGWVVAAVGAVIYPLLQFLNAPPLGEPEKRVTLTTDDLDVGTAVQILHRGQPVIVVRTGEAEVTVLSAVCTHLGCLVKWRPESETLECPCHAAQFAKDGKVLAGPPQTGLPVLAARVVDGTIVIEDAAA